MGNQVDGRFDRRSSVNWRWKNDPHLISDHLPILIGDQADWSLIGGGKTGPNSTSKVRSSVLTQNETATAMQLQRLPD